MVPLYDNRFNGHALLQRITQKTGQGLINLRALISSTRDDVSYNALLTIAEHAEENYCAFNLAIFNKMLCDFLSELYSAFNSAYPMPNLSFDYTRRQYDQLFIKTLAYLRYFLSRMHWQSRRRQVRRSQHFEYIK